MVKNGVSSFIPLHFRLVKHLCCCHHSCCGSIYRRQSFTLDAETTAAEEEGVGVGLDAAVRAGGEGRGAAHEGYVAAQDAVAQGLPRESAVRLRAWHGTGTAAYCAEVLSELATGARRTLSSAKYLGWKTVRGHHRALARIGGG